MKDLYFFSLLFLLACNNGSEKKNPEQLAPSGQNEPNAVAIEWPVTDSLEFIHYPDPANQREYRHVIIGDTSLANAIVQNIQQPAIETRECIQNSKFYLFSKGEVYKTVYVSDSCNYLAYAINSSQYFVSLSDNLGKKIDSLVNSLRK